MAGVAAMAGTTKPTVYKWIDRFEKGGLAALGSRMSTGRPRSVSGEVRARILCPFTGPVELGRCAGFDLGGPCRRVGLILGP